MEADLVERLLARVVELEAAERQRRLEAEVSVRVEAELAARKAAAQNGATENLKRSEMSPMAKSVFIREHGKSAYDALPWS